MAEAQPTTLRSPPLPRPVAVGLARCSTDGQEHSIADQRAEITAWASENGTQLLDVFEDEAVSGSELDRRGIRKLLRFLRSTPHKGTLVIWKRNRLARPDDPRDGLILERQIEQTGWSIQYLHGAQASGNKLMDTLMSAIEHHQSGEFLRSLATDVLRGQLRRALAGGFLVGVVPYGFARQVTSPSGASRSVGRKERYRRAPGEAVRWVSGEPAEVETVQRMFERFGSEKASFVGLAGELNADSIPSPRGKLWVGSTIRGMLLNPTYAGEFVWNRQTAGRFCRLIDGKATRRTKGEGPRCRKTEVEDQVRIPDHHVALVEKELFDKVGEIIARRGSRSGGRRQINRSHPLSRKVFCSQCGSSMTATRFDKRGPVYCCNGYRRSRTCECYLILAGSLERALLRKLKEVATPSIRSNLREKVVKALRTRLASDAPTVTIERLAKERKNLERKISRALDNMGVVGADVAQQIAGKIEGWTTHRRELDEKIARAKGQETKEVDLQSAADDVVALFDEIAETREDAPREALTHLFRKTVERVDLEFEVDPDKAHRKRNRHTCVGGNVVLTPFFDQAASVLPCDQYVVTDPG